MSDMPFPRIIDWLHSTYPAEIQETLAKHFFGMSDSQISLLCDIIPRDVESSLDQNMNEWLLFDAEIRFKRKTKTTGELLSEAGAPTLTKDEREMFERHAHASLRPYVVVDVIAGQGVWAYDAFAPVTAPYFIWDKGMSDTLTDDARQGASRKRNDGSAPQRLTIGATHSKKKPGRNKMDRRCGLCGSRTKKLTRTECCGNWICDDEADYEIFSYARNSCSRNHRRYTLCASHHAEGHEGTWQNCDECRASFEPELYVDFGTNEYNFETLVNPPAFEPTHCAECGTEQF